MKQIITVRLNTWAEIKELYSKLNNYYFRGQNNACWNIESSLERLAKKINIPFTDLDAREKDIVIYTKKKKHLMNIMLPHEYDHIGWLSIVRHFGGPTRLIDFTYSPYVATFFALNEKTEEAAVWALGSRAPIFWLMSNDPKTPKNFYGYALREYQNDLGNKLLHQSSTIENFLSNETNDTLKYIIDVSPIDYTNRISNQQGLFVMQSNMNYSFMDNMLSTYQIENTENIYCEVGSLAELNRIPDFSTSVMNILKIVINGSLRKEIITDLSLMNIRYSVLYPDIEGFIAELERNFEEEYINKE